MLENETPVAVGQPQIDPGPWWILNPAGKRVGAVYSWAAQGKEVWFTVTNPNGNALFAPWPAAGVADVHFVIIRRGDSVPPGAPVGDQWPFGTPGNYNPLPTQSPAVTYDVWEHTFVKPGPQTW